jgi:gamma-glutamyltranspeptidase
MRPTQVFHDGVFRLTIGTPGRYGIRQTTVQILLNCVELGMTVPAATQGQGN